MTVVINGTTGITVAAAAAPAFSAYQTAAQTLTTATYTKITVDTEEFDTNANYDPSTNYRFTPTVAGYYQVNGNFMLSASATLTGDTLVVIYKNGAQFKRGAYTNNGSRTTVGYTVSALIYLNGSTDYVELYGYATGSSLATSTGATNTYFQASMVRSA